MDLPVNHPLRIELNDEAHARPPESFVAPVQISYLALYSPAALRAAQRAHLAVLLAAFGVVGPGPEQNHFSADLGRFRLKWEMHSEFVRYKFIVAAAKDADDPFADPPILLVPPAWRAAMVGEVLVASHVALMRMGAGEPDFEQIAHDWFAGNPLVGAHIAGRAAVAVMDFRIRADGFNRLAILDRGLRPRQAGRAVQRLVEIDSYRLLAQLTLPIARRMIWVLSAHEQELAEIMAALVHVETADEPRLLERLTALAAQIESLESQTQYRFSAARAYYALVRRRIGELREERLTAIQTFHEFTELRLAPAMQTCEAAAARQDALSTRVARATQLLSTRVAMTRERQEMAVLESMNRRADLQLRLQTTVEGLSVAAISYYIAALVGDLAQGAVSAGVRVNPALVEGASVPVIVALVALAIRRIHRRVHKQIAGGRAMDTDGLRG
jgi:uncharacterized membrane-anchored protein